MRLKNISIKYNAILSVLIFIIPIFLYAFIWYYHHFREGILMESNYELDKTRQTLLSTFKSTEKNYELVASYYDSIMEKALYEYRDLYEENKDINKLPINKLKEDYSELLDFYVIDDKGVIIRSTFPLALGIDFKNFPNFYEQLTKLRMGNKIEISKLSSELKTNELRKWGFIPTLDNKYLLEVGISSSEIKKYIENFDYNKLSLETRRKNPYISELDIFDMHFISLNTMKNSMDMSLNTNLRKGFEQEVSTVFKNKDGLVVEEFIFVDSFSSFLDDTNKIIHIKYDYSSLYGRIRESYRRFVVLSLIYLVLVLVAIYYTTLFLVSRPIITLTSHIQKFSSEKNLLKKENYGNNEIGKLATSFANLSLELDTTYTSKETLQDIINSVGELFIIFDKNLDVEFINKYGLLILGYTLEDLSHLKGSSLTYILPNISKDKVRELVKRYGRAETLESELSIPTGRLILSSVFTPVRDTGGEIKGYTCISKDITDVKIEFSRIEQSNIKLLKKSNTDWLTNFYNKNYILNYLMENFSLKGLTLIFFDIDNFKTINDTFGHPIGDRVLMELSSLVRKKVGKDNIIGRYGGDEFVIILPHKTLEEGSNLFEIIRSSTENHLFTTEKIQFTLSGGIASSREVSSYKELLKVADDRLYKAKNSGKNKSFMK